MANEKEPTPGTRGWRADQVRKALGLDRQDFARALATVAAELGLDGGAKWTQSRVSRLILNRQPTSLEDAASIMALAARKGLKQFTWDWFVLGDRKVGKLKPRPGEQGNGSSGSSGSGGTERKRA